MPRSECRKSWGKPRVLDSFGFQIFQPTLNPCNYSSRAAGLWMPIPTNTCKSTYWTFGSWIRPNLTPGCYLNKMISNTWNIRSCCCCCWMWGTSIWEYQMFNRWLMASAARILTSGSGSFSSSIIATMENIKTRNLCIAEKPHKLMLHIKRKCRYK